MVYMLLDGYGNAIESFDDEPHGREFLASVLATDPEIAREMMLVAFDHDGLAVGDAVTTADIAPPVTVDDLGSLGSMVFASFSRTFRPLPRVVCEDVTPAFSYALVRAMPARSPVAC